MKIKLFTTLPICILLFFITSSCNDDKSESDKYDLDYDTGISHIKDFEFDATSLEYANLLNANNLRTVITRLASDEFEGRSPDLPSIKKTEEYLADYLEKTGISKWNGITYFQEHPEKDNFTNVIGIIEGQDLKDEYIILCAHFDHLGKNEDGEIFYGADDNASGVSAVLEIGDKMIQAKNDGNGPRRSVILLLTTGEEKFFVGSYLYTNQPPFSLEKTMAFVNLDMIGRKIPQYSRYGNAYSIIYNDSNHKGDLLTQARNVNAYSVKQVLDTVNHPFMIDASDAVPFMSKNIPSITIASGIHEEYHTPKDKVELIDFDATLQRTKLTFHLIWHLANRD